MLQVKPYGHEAAVFLNKNHHVELRLLIKRRKTNCLWPLVSWAMNRLKVGWLIDIGCTNYMTFDKALLRDLRSTSVIKVRIEMILVKGKGITQVVSAQNLFLTLLGGMFTLWYVKNEIGMNQRRLIKLLKICTKTFAQV